MKQIIALQEYSDKYISLYEGEIRNIEDILADKLIEQGIVAEHNDNSNSNNIVFIEENNHKLSMTWQEIYNLMMQQQKIIYVKVLFTSGHGVIQSGCGLYPISCVMYQDATTQEGDITWNVVTNLGSQVITYFASSPDDFPTY